MITCIAIDDEPIALSIIEQHCNRHGGLTVECYSSPVEGMERIAVTRPDIVFLDEPTAGLDVEGRISLHKYIRTLKAEGKTILLASHDMAEVESLCDNIAILKDGQIVFAGTVEQLTKTVGIHYNICVKTEQGTETFEADDIGESLISILKGYQDKNVDILDIQVDRGSLEQHFVKITRGE